MGGGNDLVVVSVRKKRDYFRKWKAVGEIDGQNIAQPKVTILSQSKQCLEYHSKVSLCSIHISP